MAIQSDQEFAPTQIARATFPTAFRGYDQDAVRRYLSRLATELEHKQEYADLGTLETRTPAHSRVEQLEEEVETLNEEIRDLEVELVQRSLSIDDGSVPKVVRSDSSASNKSDDALDESRAIEFLGQETARVLESARSAASDILKRAEGQAKAMERQASEHLAEARSRAEALVADKQAKIEALVEKLENEAETSAAKMTSEAEQYHAMVLEESAKIMGEAEVVSEAQREQAQERAREIVTDAETLRQQVVAELIIERRDAGVELEQMGATRDRVAMSLSVARTEIDAIAADLERSSLPVFKPGVSDQPELVSEVMADPVKASSTKDLSKDTSDDLTAETPLARLDSNGDELLADGGLTTQFEAEVSHRRGKQNGDDGTSGAAVDGLPTHRDQPDSESPAGGESDDDTSGEIGFVGADSKNGSNEQIAGKGSSDDKKPSKKAIRKSQAANKKRKSRGKGAQNRATASGTNGADKHKVDVSNGDVPRVDARAGSVGNGANKAFDKGRDQFDEILDDLGLEPRNAAVKTSSADEITPIVLDLSEVEDRLDDDGSNAPEIKANQAMTMVDGFTTIDLAEEAFDLSQFKVLEPEADDVGSVSEVKPPDSIITTVAARSTTSILEGNRGDIELDEPVPGKIPDAFSVRDVALARFGPDFRRLLRRALNDDQSDVLDRLRAGRRTIEVSELPAFGDQIDCYLRPLRRSLGEVAQAGAAAGGQSELSHRALDNLVRQLAKFVVDQVRVPTVEAVTSAKHNDREKILEPIRAVYRDFRNGALPDLTEDALYEAFAIGLYDSIEPAERLTWLIDPRTDPDPVCEINATNSDVAKGETFASGHSRPLAMPGCRCLVVSVRKEQLLK